jgi:undecaprenyl diphosphate synthase
VRVRFIGRRGRPVPRRLVQMMEDTEARTATHDRMTLQVAFNYGGRAEIADAARRVAGDAVEGRLRADRVTEQSVHARLYSPDAPDVDLLVRTSGEQRMSNFLLWEAAYAELVFSEVLWPDFGREHLFAAVAEYQRRARRFGRL